jgi:hypothetical protein
MNERKVIVKWLIVIVIFGVILGGFAYAYRNLRRGARPVKVRTYTVKSIVAV